MRSWKKISWIAEAGRHRDYQHAEANDGPTSTWRSSTSWTSLKENFIGTKRSPKQQKDFFIKIVPMGSKGANTGTTNAQKYKIKSTKSWLKIHLLYKSFEWYVSWSVVEWIDMNGFNKCLNVPAKWFHFISSFPVASTCKDFCDEMLSYYSCFNVSQQSIVNLLH